MARNFVGEILVTPCGIHAGCEMRMLNGITTHKQLPGFVTQRDATYNNLTRRFEGVAVRLDEKGKAELDGLLWDLAAQIAVSQGIVEKNTHK